MRLSTKRLVLQSGLFASALLFILCLNLNGSDGEATFAWTTVRYQTTASSLPNARGRCPGLGRDGKPALVVSRVAADGDAAWLDRLVDRYHLCVYTVDAPRDDGTTYLQVPANRGHESMAYLTFIIDNYDLLPAAGVVFVHGSRFAWHNDHGAYDNSQLLAKLNISAALAPHGYHNMRCDWSASSCSSSYGPPQNSLETAWNAKLQPWDYRAKSDVALVKALGVIFAAHGGDEGNERVLLGRSDALRAQCCAQFVVARERILQHSRNEYIALRQWLLDGSKDSTHRNNHAAPADDKVAGRILSYIWHILFLPHSNPKGRNLTELNQLGCPSAPDCYCRLYGLCDLERCTMESCHRQYTLPTDFSLPDDWASTHP